MELKHASAYLPYDLKYATLSDDDGETYFVDKKHNTIGVGCNQSNVTNICLIEYSRPIYKIILRPLSDLTKEIEHNGKKFVPLYRLIKEDKAFTNDFINVFGYEELKLSVYELLLEYHFDVFGLIKQGLAIDINTLNK